MNKSISLLNNLGGILLKEIKTKPEGNPKVLDTAARVPNSALKALWLKSKEKSISELKETPFASKRQESANEPANTAGEQMLSGMETAAKKGANLAWRGGKKLAQDTARKIREKRALSRAAETLRDTGIRAGKIGSDTAGNLPKNIPSARPQAGSIQKTGKSVGEAAKSGARAVRQSAKTVRSSVKTAEYTVKTAQKSIKTAEQAGKSTVKTAQVTAKTAQQAAQATVKTVKLAVPVVKAAAKAAVTGVKAAAKATAAAVKAAATGIKSLAAAIAAGGWIAVVIVVVICCVGMFLAMLMGGGQQMETTWEGTGIFEWPLPGDFSITSPFGYRTDPITGESSFHDGVDIAAPEGTAILAAADGVVVTANRTDSWGGSYGYYVKIRHDETYETLYAHCSEVLVKAGQEVEQGDVVALVGSTGNSTGNHLHFEVREGGNKVDAMGFFTRFAETTALLSQISIDTKKQIFYNQIRTKVLWR